MQHTASDQELLQCLMAGRQGIPHGLGGRRVVICHGVEQYLEANAWTPALLHSRHIACRPRCLTSSRSAARQPCMAG